MSVYSSTDLRSWRSHGLAFDARSADWQGACTPGGCFRPHVIYNARDKQYVMWINVFSGSYRVLTSSTPTGPWTLRPGAGSVPSNSGDQDLFVDSDGTGYLVRTDLNGRQATAKSHELEIDTLDASYLHVSAITSRPALGFVEAPTIWKRGATYYLAYSDPACPYCPATGTSVVTASSLAGPWSTPYSIAATSCQGQPTHVSKLVNGSTVTYLYQSDQWRRPDPRVVLRNQAAATQAWAPLSFTASGQVEPVNCSSN